jgi:hypothetical protein
LKWHQQLTENFGARKLVSRCCEIIGLAETCTSIRKLREKVAQRYGKEPIQLTLYLPKQEPKEAANRGGLYNPYFQPACLLQDSRARGLDFSHCVMDFDSLLSIRSFMHMQYLRAMAGVAPDSPLLSSMHSLIHLTSSALSFWADAGTAAVNAMAATTAKIDFIVRPFMKNHKPAENARARSRRQSKTGHSLIQNRPLGVETVVPN